MPEIARLSHTHEAIMDWMLENPGRSLRECAAFFGYSQPWISTVIHSDVFQAKLRERRDDIDAVIAADIPSKLRAVADIALERLADAVSKSDSPGFIHETADMVLNRLGYGPQRGGGVTVNAAPQVQFVISRDDLAQARGAIIDGYESPARLQAGYNPYNPPALDGSTRKDPPPASSGAITRMPDGVGSEGPG